jgi:hypothetical protein
MIVILGNRNTHVKASPNSISPSTNSERSGVLSNADLRGESPSTNSVNDGKALSVV